MHLFFSRYVCSFFTLPCWKRSSGAHACRLKASRSPRRRSLVAVPSGSSSVIPSVTASQSVHVAHRCILELPLPPGSCCTGSPQTGARMHDIHSLHLHPWLGSELRRRSACRDGARAAPTCSGHRWQSSWLPSATRASSLGAPRALPRRACAQRRPSRPLAIRCGHARCAVLCAPVGAAVAAAARSRRPRAENTPEEPCWPASTTAQELR